MTLYNPIIIYAYTNINGETDGNDPLTCLRINHHCDRYDPTVMRPDDETARKIPNKFWMALMDKYASTTIGYVNADVVETKEYHRHLSKEA